jgi:hypothetical protein
VGDAKSYPFSHCPDFFQPEVLARQSHQDPEHDHSLSFEAVRQNTEKLSKSSFLSTPEDEWRDTVGQEFAEIMTGRIHGAQHPQHLDFNIGDEAPHLHPQAQTPQHLTMSADVDSGMGWLPSLAAINADLQFILPPILSRNLEASVHHFMNTGQMSPPVRGLEPHQVTAPIHQVNHFLLAEFGDLTCRFQIYLFLPAIYRPSSKGNKVPFATIDRFVSDCLLPAFREFLPSHLLEQVPHEMWEAIADAEAPRIEGQINGPAGNDLSPRVTVPQKYLRQIWDYVKQAIKDKTAAYPHHYDALVGCRLLWSFKGLKYGLSTDNWSELGHAINKVTI